LKERIDGDTRGSVQKSVCVLSTRPFFGAIRSILEPCTQVYFNQGSLHNTIQHNTTQNSKHKIQNKTQHNAKQNHTKNTKHNTTQNKTTQKTQNTTTQNNDTSLFSSLHIRYFFDSYFF
jgi:hypothetical protein